MKGKKYCFPFAINLRLWWPMGVTTKPKAHAKKLMAKPNRATAEVTSSYSFPVPTY